MNNFNFGTDGGGGDGGGGAVGEMKMIYVSCRVKT